MNAAELLRSYGLSPKKSLGQNFLVDQNSLEKIVKAGGVQPGDVILEIGPGLGGLTRLLAQAARRVVAVELDQNLLGPLGEVLAPFDNVTIIHGDILKLNPAALIRPHLSGAGDYLVIANIPYYITSALIRQLLESELPPRRIVLTVQREVAERICAAPPRMNLLGLSVQAYGQPSIAARIPAGAFYPPPKVDSAVVEIVRAPEPLIPPGQLELFFRLAKAGFSQKRKTIRNAVSAGMARDKDATDALLTRAGIDPQRRAETLSLDEWRKLVNVWEAAA